MKITSAHPIYIIGSEKDSDSSNIIGEAKDALVNIGKEGAGTLVTNLSDKAGNAAQDFVDKKSVDEQQAAAIKEDTTPKTDASTPMIPFEDMPDSNTKTDNSKIVSDGLYKGIMISCIAIGVVLLVIIAKKIK